MKELLSYVVAAGLVVGGATIAWTISSWWIRRRWPASIPEDLRFEHELESSRNLREIAEELALRFSRSETTTSVRCLGPTRGAAARVLFHAGPTNRGRDVNIHRPDYVLQVRRLSATRARLELNLNLPYSYFRAHRGELEELNRALRRAYGDLERV